jgi:hypothetical protein
MFTITNRFRLAVLIVTVASLTSPHARASLTLRCNWGVGALAPTVSPNSTQVIATPVVLNFGRPGGLAQIAFVSFETNLQGNRDGGGVLRMMDPQCHEIARFPDPACTYPPIANAPPGFTITGDLAPLSGIAAGKLTGVGNAAIIAVIGGPTSSHRQIAAFNLVGNCIMPLWVSSATALPPGDFIPISAPAIAQLDRPPSPDAEIVLDNKVFNANGTLRYTGFNGGGNNCATAPGGAPCPRSRTVIVANVMGQPLPQIITGRGIYASTSPIFWTGPVLQPPIIVPGISKGPQVYPAIAELDPSSPTGPEIVVVDTMLSTLSVLSSVGGVRASASIPSPPATSPKCGGPPMIGDAGGLAGPEIGVASCTRYTLFKYNAGVLTQAWSMPTHDVGGQTTSTLYNGPNPRIAYADESRLWIFNATTGAVIQGLSQNSATAIEGPVIASLDTGHPEPTCHMGHGNLIVVSNNIWPGTNNKGVRIFDDLDIGMVASCWNEHSFHITNVGNSYGMIPQFEAPSWTGLPARNTFRVQSWP